MQILRETFKNTTKKGKSRKDVFVNTKQQLQWPHSMSHEVCLLIATGIISNMMYINELQNKAKLGYLISFWFIPKFVIFSENLTINLTKQRSLSVGFITYFRVIQTKTYIFYISNTTQILLR